MVTIMIAMMLMRMLTLNADSDIRCRWAKVDEYDCFAVDGGQYGDNADCHGDGADGDSDAYDHR